MAEQTTKQIDATISFRGLEEVDDQVVIYFRHGKDEELFRLGLTRDDATTFVAALGVMLSRVTPGAITVEFVSAA